MTTFLARCHHWKCFARRSPVFLVAALSLLSVLSPSILFAGSPDRLDATLLTRDLGDPRAPGNLKIALTLPDSLASNTASAVASDFMVYVYPEELPEERGTISENLAGGIYVWRRGAKIFLDVRVVPVREREGPATVKIVYAPGGRPAATGYVHGALRYTTDLADVILAVDVSRSMIYNDPDKRRVVAARAFMEMAREGGGIGRVGLVTFNHRAKVQTPPLPLEQGGTLLSALNRVGADGLTSLDAPLRLGMRELSKISSHRPVIVLLTDGKNEGSDYKNTHLECAEAGVRLFTVGLTESADHELLKEMADATGGMYFRAPQDSDLPEIYARLAAELGKRRLLHAEMLRKSEGSVIVPVDGTVRRLVALADSGARLGVSGPGGKTLFTGDAITNVHMGTPVPGDWEFRWQGAEPNQSLLALFGDTPFFLDVFPPQLHGDQLAVGATLAQGARALSDAEVWIEPIPGLLESRIRLFDDGRHGDSLAGDGVYGAVAEYAGDVDSFDIIVRASGAAWEEGSFVRQGTGFAVRSPEPLAVWTAKLDGDLDFGVLFPGETGVALARIDLNGPEPRRLYVDLEWDAPNDDWPHLASQLTMEPGIREFEMEMTVPETAVPGEYRGRFDISDHGGLDDRASARVKVGTVRFTAVDAVDLGEVPPGTFASRTVEIEYDADKRAPLSARARSADNELELAAVAPELPEGKGSLPLDIVVSVPIGKPEGEYAGHILVRAGPGIVGIPVRWRVKALAVAVEDLTPLEGLPQPPGLGIDDTLIPETASEMWRPGSPGHDSISLDTPGPFAEKPGLPAPRGVDALWEKTAELFKEGGPTPNAEPRVRADDLDFPSIAAPKPRGDSFWNAWWIYLLAALLLLLLLLLLLAYILYRLGKSSVARFLLASALANIVLMIVFIVLLGTVASVAARDTATIAVTLTREDDRPPFVELTQTEKSMINTAGKASEMAGAGEATVGEITFDAAQASGGELLTERRNAPADSAREEVQLADAGQASAVPLERQSAEPMQRRQRRHARIDHSQSLSELPEMAEPPLDTGRETREREEPDEMQRHAEVGEARVAIEDVFHPAPPAWSETERVSESRINERDVTLAESVGTETVNLDETQRRLEPRGRRRTQRELPTLYPEPRVEIDDPVRDSLETAMAEAVDRRQPEPGVEEIRIEPPAMASAASGEKPGVIVPPGAANLRVDAGADGDSETGKPRAAATLVGKRLGRTGGARSVGSRTAPSGGAPGGLAQTRSDPGGGKNHGVDRGDAVGERRFDTVSGGSDGSSNGGSTFSGKASSPAGSGTMGASPNPFRSGGGAGPEAFAHEGGPSGRGESGMPRRGRRDAGGNPDGSGRVPGGNGENVRAIGNGDDRGGPASGRGGRRGLGEGRFDDMASGVDASVETSRGGAAIAAPGRSDLSGAGAAAELDVIPYPSTDDEWRRNERRLPIRQMNVAASSVDTDSLLIVVGDFARLPDPAAENLFGVLSRRMTGGMTVEERRLTPNDVNLDDSLLALITPDEVDDWSDAAVGRVAEYLHNGGHLWMDARSPEQARPFMTRLARAADGDFGPLGPGHQLSDGEKVDALTLDGNLAAVVTYQDWRRDWRYGDRKNGRAFRFLIRSLNYFLSGNAESGIVLEDEKISDDLYVEPTSSPMPELLSDNAEKPGRVWDDFGTATAAAWRLPSWSDPGRVTAISDGQGGRALKLDLDGAVKGRAAVYRALRPPQDFSHVDRVSLDVYYDGSGPASASMVLTVPDDSGWSDYESPARNLSPGWNRLIFPLGGGDFRALSAAGNFDSVVPADDRVGRVGFFIYRDADGAAAAMFRDIRLHEN